MSLTFITACGLCNLKFATPGFADLLKTDSGRVKVANVFQSLSLHLQKKHREQAQKADLAAAMFGGLLRLMNFHSDDPVAQQMRDWNRHVVHEMTRAVTCPDNKIQEQVAALGLNEYTALRVTTLIKQMRDVIEERGAFAPPDPTKASNGQPSEGPTLVLP
jgi:hypothetical protein